MGGYVSSGQFIPQEVRDEFDRLSKLKLGVITNQYDNLSKEHKNQYYLEAEQK